MKKLLSAAALAAGITLTAFANGAVENPYQPPRKKVIDLSWSGPSLNYLAENLARMEAEAPIDGVTVRFVGRRPGVEGRAGEVYCNQAFTKEKWQYEWFAGQIAKYKGLRFTRFTDNFLPSSMRPAQNMDWFDDEYWAAICNNFGILARITKECGMQGILFDSEEYAGGVWGKYKGSERTAAIAKARQRGQEWGRAVFTANPDIKIFCLFFLSHGTFIMGDAEASTLIHSFYNGIMDVMPPTARIMDGHEYFGYFARNRKCFVQLRYDVDYTFLSRVSANNYQKYRTQVQFAPPFYVDSVAYANNVCHKYLKPEIDNQPTLDYIRQSVWNAMCVADEYIWTYSELGCWWTKSSHPRVKGSWEQQLPGITAIMQELRAISALDLSNAGNILMIPQLNADPAVKEPGPWSVWQHDPANPSDKSGWKDGKVYITGPQSDTNVFQQAEVKAGQTYLLRVEARVRSAENNGFIYMGVRFRNAAGQILAHRREVRIQPLSGYFWESMVFMTTAPAGATHAEYMLGVRGLLTDQVIEFQHPQMFDVTK